MFGAEAKRMQDLASDENRARLRIGLNLLSTA